MKAVTPEKKYYREDQYGLARLDVQIEHCKNLIQDAINGFKKLKLGPLTMDLLKSFFEDESSRISVSGKIEEFIAERIFQDKLPAYEELGLDPVKARGLMAIPDYSDFKKALDQFRNPIPGPAMYNGVPWHVLNLENEEVTLIPEEVEKEKDNYRSFPQTKDEESRVKMVQEICALLNKLVEEYPTIKSSYMIPGELSMPGIISFDLASGFFPSQTFILSGSNQQRVRRVDPIKPVSSTYQSVGDFAEGLNLDLSEQKTE